MANSTPTRSRLRKKGRSQWSVAKFLPGQPIVRRGGKFAALKRVGYVGRRSVNQIRTKDKFTPSAVLLYYTHNGLSKRWKDMKGAEQDRFAQKIIEGVIANRYGNHSKKIIPRIIGTLREPSLLELIQGRSEMVEKRIDHMRTLIEEGSGDMEQGERKALLQRLKDLSTALRHIALGVQKGRFRAAYSY